MFEKVKIWFQSIDDIEKIKRESYLKGSEETTNQFLQVQKRLMEKIEELSNINIITEKRIRNESDLRIQSIETNASERIQSLESLFHQRCLACKSSMEAQRIAIIKKQSGLNSKLTRVDDLIKRIFNHVDGINAKQQSILRASSQIIASKDIIETFTKELNDITNDSSSLLSVEMIDTEIMVENKVNELLKEREKEISKEQSEIIVLSEEIPPIEVK